MTTLNKTIKVPWAEFKTLAILKLKEKYPTIIEGEAEFMKYGQYEPDGKCYDTPDYVEIPID